MLESPPGAEVVLDGRRYLYFAGTAYHALQGHPEVIRAGCQALAQFGLHSATSRTGFGTQPPVAEVEQAAAQWMDAEEAFYFVSGFVGGQVLAELCSAACDAVFIDDQTHYSLRDAVVWFRLPVYAFRHREPEDLAQRLRTQLRPGERPLVLTDGVFSLTGRIAPLDKYLELLASYPGAILAIDDAHGTAVLGEKGRGTFEHFGLHDAQVNRLLPGDAVGASPGKLLVTTLSKAAGGHGGLIAGGATFIRALKAKSHFYRGASAPAAPVAAATAAALRLLLADPGHLARLRSNVAYFKHGLRMQGLPVDGTPVPIVNLVLGTSEDMQQLQQRLLDEGIAVGYFGDYSGAEAEGSLRLAVFSTHTEELIDRLLDALRRVL